MAYEPEQVVRAQISDTWSAIARTGVDVASLGSWDSDLLREPRVLVPVDVQALVIGPGDDEPVVLLPSPLSPGATEDATSVDGPEPFSAGTPRPAGVHLHWAAPDALLRGTLQDPHGRSGGGLGLAALPDHWAVLRLLAPAKASRVHVRGWLVDAATASVRDLATGAAADLPPAHALPAAELTGTAGGSLTWSGSYDAAYGRFAWHDPLDDLVADPELGGELPGGPAGRAATYLVAGWWSDPELDPLDDVRTGGGLAERTRALGWRIVQGGGAEHTERQGSLERTHALGLPVATRLSPEVSRSKQRSISRRGEVARPGSPFQEAQFSASTVSAFQSIGATSLAKEALTWVTGRGVGVEASTLVHGAVVGVPLPPAEGEVVPDLRPPADAVQISFGEQVDDLVAASLAAPLTGGAPEAKRALERLLSAFSARLLSGLGSPDGLVDVDQREHTGGFAAVPSGEPPLVDRARSGRASVPTTPPRPQASTSTGQRLKFVLGDTKESVAHLRTEPAYATVAKVQRLAAAGTPGGPQGAQATVAGGEQRVERPTPPRWLPVDPVVGLTGAGRSLRHGGDGRGDADELLACRRASQVGTAYTGLVRGADLLPTLGSGALPAEVLALAQEALLLSPHLGGWLAAHAARTLPGVERPVAARRLGAELALRFTADGAYLGKAEPGAATIARGDADGVRLQVAETLRWHSLFDGVEPDLVALTSWAQPWVPMWLEWEATASVAGSLDGWALGAVDLEPQDDQPAAARTVTVSGRSPLTTAPGTALAGAIASWLTEETARDKHDQGEADDETARRLGALGRAAAGLDLVGASLDGLRVALIGLPRTALRARAADGTTSLPAPVDLPSLLAAGALTLARLRLVDAFGRTLDLHLDGVRTPSRVESAEPATLHRRPRLQAPTRCTLRLVGAESVDPRAATDAVVDEVDAAHQVNPVVGFLLPDHVDESIEVFSTDGTPLGELLTESSGGGVVWEPAPGRPLPADAAPGAGLTADQRALGLLAAGMVTADAASRGGRTADDPDLPAEVSESALAAFLRAVDTTLWTVDPLSGAGSSGMASVVGRPVAVVRAVVQLDVAPDLDVLDLDAAGRAARAAAYAELAALRVHVRVGELTRTDDGVLGWYVDDDFTSFHVVDRVVRELALEGGKRKGHLGPWGTTPITPVREEILHPFLAGADLLELRAGVPRMLTLLMLPGSRAHLTCGLVPRTSVALSRAWFAPGLERLSPSIRVGPVLIDPGEVRLPTVASLGERQVLTTRDGPLSWRNDAILAATQSALLPDRAAGLREGWIRVDPSPAPADEP